MGYVWGNPPPTPAAPPVAPLLIIAIPFKGGQAIGTVLYSLSRGAWIWQVRFFGPHTPYTRRPLFGLLSPEETDAGHPTSIAAYYVLQELMRNIEIGLPAHALPGVFTLPREGDQP